jgi:asparagine synthase (glutamine-hydrolysing)
MKAAKENNCIVLLDGQGGDETLLGYERYYTSFLSNVSLSRKIAWFNKISKNSKLRLKDVMSYYLYFNFPSIRRSHLRRRIGDINKQYEKYLNDDLINEYSLASKTIYELQKLEIEKTQLRSLLNYEDKNSMAWSVETRLPFLDYEVVEAAISIKPEYKINNGWSKYLLRQIGSKVLPQEIAWRKNKIGFEAPASFQEINSHFDSIISDSYILKSIFKNNMERRGMKTDWKLLSIALWEKHYNMHL